MDDATNIARCRLPAVAVKYLSELLPSGFVVLYEMPKDTDGAHLVMMANLSKTGTALYSVASAVDVMLRSHLG